MRHAFDLIFGTALLVGALTALVRPVVIVRWAKRAHSQLREDDNAALWTARPMGIGGLLISAFFG